MDPREARNLIPLTEHYIHMNHAGVSPMSERGRARHSAATRSSSPGRDRVRNRQVSCLFASRGRPRKKCFAT